MIKDNIWNIFQKVRKKNPLIQNITNFVVMPYTANILLAAGASPIMSNITDEFKELYKATKAISINIGMLDPLWEKNIIESLKIAKAHGLPVVFDPVGSGATNYRTNFSKKIIKEFNIKVVRGNPSEILSLSSSLNANSSNASKGVDSCIDSEQVLEHAKIIAKTYNTIIALTGKDDYVTDGEQIYKLSNGSVLMQKVIGMGCTLSSFIASFIAVEKNYLNSAVAAVAIYGVAGQLAERISSGPGSFQQNFIDTLYHLKKENFINNLIILKC
ncbi:hydroxyethylthiazole kinase [Candidatus Aquarickettsia rohweri]|uniref:Hydroxyethylthiazole kinase n=1 Tax=Candidatus Aquarickettsia rohweri TaxID=2602574 RepID=A0A429XGT8_9RICK|nr:hydroxyethylthiazole kinase [Candidatus Aquarickettsia rohweri]RST64748.1 hydroxyethylthiazole kinase [Candidatus Aquarickettsia rohweri]